MQHANNPAASSNAVSDTADLVEKASRADRALLFYKELTDEVESFTVLADLYGVRTLADVIYLQAAILKGTCIENAPKLSFIVDIVRALPSAKVWLKYITNVGK